MSFVEWSEELSVGIPQVDGEHQNLVKCLNLLDEAIKKGKGTRIMGEILSQLVEYTVIHFESEEKLMRDSEYPGLVRHQSQHRQLVEKVERFQQKFVHNGQRITSDMMDFLKYWLANHILVDDMAFGAFFAECPQRESIEAGIKTEA